MSSSALELELPDGTRLSVPAASTPLDVAKQIGPGLAKAALSSRLDGAWVDLRAAQFRILRASLVCQGGEVR